MPAHGERAKESQKGKLTMTKPTFRMPVKGSTDTIEVKYDPIIYTRLSSMVKLALHREHIRSDKRRDWVVSDPVSGYRILRVTALHRGCPVRSYDLPLRLARQFALADLDALVDRVGPELFFQAIDRAREHVAAA